MNDVLTVATKFLSRGEILALQAYGSGNVNDTFLVMVAQ